MHRVRNLIRKWRKSKGLSQENMATDLGISQTAYTNLENGHTQMTVERLVLIARLLDRDVVDFFVDIQKEKVGDVGVDVDETTNDVMSPELYDKIAQLKEEIDTIERLIGESK